MKWILPLAVAAGILQGAGTARAAEADWNACESAENLDAQIAACTRIAGDSAVTGDAKAEAHYLRANAYGAKGDFDKAIADYGTAIGLADYATYFAARCWAYTQRGDTAQALSDCNKAVELNPDLVLGYTNRGAVFEKMGDRAKAIESYKAALAVKTEDAGDLAGQEDAKQALARLQGKAS
jgi:tetratricopeptide (TPR) repeat protein